MKNSFNFLLLVIIVLAIVSMGSYTANAQIKVSENFDAGTTIPSGWTTAAVSGKSTIGVLFNTPAAIGHMGNGTWLGGAYSSPNIAAFNIYAAANGAEERLITPVLDLSAATGPVFTFQWTDASMSSKDSMVIEVTTDGGTTWTPFADGHFVTRAPGTATNNWQAKTVNISAYANTSNVQFAFHAYGNYGYNFGIDNVFIGQPPANDLGVTAITLPAATAYRTAPNTITATVTNYGTNTQTTYNMHVKIWKTTGGSEGSPEFESTEAGPSIGASPATASFSFASQWTPAEYVAYTVKVYTELSGDETSGNDPLSKSVTIIPATDMQILSVVYPATTNLYTGTLGYSVRAQVKNNGTSASGTTYTVEAWIGLTAGFDESTAPYHHFAIITPSIAAGGTANVDITDTWVPADPGVYTVRFKVTLAGDEIASNDKLDASRTVLSDYLGGPDGGGYYYITDERPSGAKPTYNWLEIAGAGGTALNFTSDDQNSADISIPSFTFYGNTYTSLRVNNNGFIRFDGSANSSYYSNPSIPSATVPNYLLAPFWDDMGLVSGTTNIYYMYEPIGNQFIIEFKDIPLYGQTTNLKTFQVILKYTSPNCVYFQYNTMPGSNTGSTIGIEGSGAASMGTQWLYNGTPATAVTALTSGHVIYFGTSSTTIPTIDNLPVQLASFVGQVNTEGSGIKLSWETVSEVNNYGFFVERRSDNEQNFTEVVNSFIAGAGTTLEPKSYSFVDNTITAPGIYHYRLRQQDNDGLIHYSNVVSINGSALGIDETVPVEFRVYQNYPNPFNPSTQIKFTVEKTEHALVSVFNVLGQEVAVLFNGVADPGKYYSLKFDGAKFTSGLYFYKVVTNSRSDIKKMLLVK